jgi:hypothetical protein
MVMLSITGPGVSLLLKPSVWPGWRGTDNPFDPGLFKCGLTTTKKLVLLGHKGEKDHNFGLGESHATTHCARRQRWPLGDPPVPSSAGDRQSLLNRLHVGR